LSIGFLPLLSAVMRFLLQQKFLLALGAVLFFSTIMTVRQVTENQSRHAELREALILLQSRNQFNEADEIYTRLLRTLKSEPTRHLIDDIQRTSFAAPTNQSPETNLVVRYHRFVKNELDRRIEQEYLKARKLAEGEQ